MFLSNNILSALVHSDVALLGEVTTKDLQDMTDQEMEGLFRDALLGAAGKEEDMLTLFSREEQVVPYEPDLEKSDVSSQEMLSALSFLSVVGVIPQQTSYQTLQNTQPTWTQGPLSASVSVASDAESVIQTILTNTVPSYVASPNRSSMGISNNAIALDDAGLDTLIASLLVGKNNTHVDESAMADLRWNHFNEMILANGNQIESDLKGFTFEPEAKTENLPLTGLTFKAEDQTEALPRKGLTFEPESKTENLPLTGLTFETEDEGEGLPLKVFSSEPEVNIKSLLKNAKSPRILSPVSQSEPFRITTSEKLTEPIVVNGQTQIDTNETFNPEDFTAFLTDSKPVSDTAIVERPLLGTLPQSVDKIATNNYAPKWRPIDQLVEHEIVKQVADKLSIQRLNVKSGDGVTIELEPKELGALKIEISIHKNLVSADILTQHASVRDILDKNQSLLRDAMTQMGFNVDKFSVNVGDFNQLQQHFSRRESFNKQSGTDFAFNNREGNSAESLFDRAGSGSKYWGHVESRVSVYV